MVKTTKYFDFTKGREDRKIIKQEWIVSAMEHPIHEEIKKMVELEDGLGLRKKVNSYE